MLDSVDRTGGFTVCVGGDVTPVDRPGLVKLPFDAPLTTDFVIMWRGERRPRVVDDIEAFLDRAHAHRSPPTPPSPVAR